jgi:L-ribulose-5-phosphate 3-epimerase
MNGMPVGLFEKALPPALSWQERLATAARIGYDFVEMSVDDSDERIARLDWGPKERAALRNAMLTTGVPISSMSLSAHRRFPLGSDSPAVRQTGLDILKKAIDLAVDAHLGLVQVAGCDVYYEPSTEASRGRYLDGLARGLEWASAAGVVLGLENWDVGVVGSTHQALEYIRHFNTPWLQYYVDLGNLAYRGHDVPAELGAGRGVTVAVHVRDARPGQLQVPLGEGTVPFDKAFASLAAINFRGLVVMALTTGTQPRAVETAAGAWRWAEARMAEGWRLFNG